MGKNEPVPEAWIGSNAQTQHRTVQINLTLAGTEHTVSPQQVFHLRALSRPEPIIRIPEIQPSAEIAVSFSSSSASSIATVLPPIWQFVALSVDVRSAGIIQPTAVAFLV